ncbi:MAG TPA: hypothetical protein PKL77_06035 [Candidatus Omnitrophota bacterium]|nr:hypothetical protein [Candidatus Omnitrophota bacterium]
MSRYSELKSQLAAQKTGSALSRSAALKKLLAEQKAAAAKKKASVTAAITVKPNYALSNKGTKEAITAQINTAGKITSANAASPSKSNFEKNLFSSAAASNERTALIEAARKKAQANAAAKKAAIAAEKAAQATAVAKAVTPKVSDINRSAANVDYTPEIAASEANYKAENPVIAKPKFKNYAGGASQVGAAALGGMVQSAAALADAAKASIASEEDNPVFKYIDNAKKMLKTIVTGKTAYPESKQITAEDYDTDKIQKYYLGGNTVQDKAETFSQKLMSKAMKLGDKQVSDGLLSLASSAGYMIPSQIANAIIPSSGLALLFVSGYSTGNKQAVKAGASPEEANAYALLNGLNDSAVELISGGLLGKGKGLADSALKAVGLDLTKYITNPALKATADYIVSSLGEGGEEIIQGLFDTAFQRMTYNKEASVDAGQLAQEGLIGAAMGGLYGAAEIPSKIAYNKAVNASGADETSQVQLPEGSEISAQAKPSAALKEYYANELNSLMTKTRTGEEEFKLREINRAVNETEKTGILYGAPEETIKTAAKLSKASGIDIVFFKSEAYNGTIKNGFTKDGIIYMNAESKSPASWIFAHELSDNLEKTKAFEKLKTLVKSRIDDYDAKKAGLISTYEKAGIALSSSDADRELVSNYAGDKMFTDEESIYNAVRQDRTIGEKIRDWLSSMIKKLTGSDEEKFLIKARNLYVKALNQVRTESMKAQASSIEAEEETGKTVYRDALGRPVSKATISISSGDVFNNGQRNYRFSSVIDRKKIPYNGFGVYNKETEKEDVDRIVAQMNDNGWDAKISKNGFNESVISLTHRDTQRLMDETKKAENNKFSNAEKGFIRFGKPPETGKSINFRDNQPEDGVSVFRAEFAGEEYRMKLNPILEASYLTVMNRPAYRVYGEVIGSGSDGEPIMKVTKSVKLGEKKKGSTDKVSYSISDTEEIKERLSKDVNFKKLEKENAELKEQNEEQRRQFTLTKTFEPNPSSVMSYVRQLKKGYNSTVTNQVVFGKMKTLFEYMANGDPETGMTSWEEAYAMARDVAGDILSNSRVVSNESELERYGEIKKYLKNKTFYVPAESEENFGDFKEFKKKYQGKIKITSDESKGTSADELYSEMTDLYGEALFPSDIVNPSDQLMQIADVASSLNAIYENPYTGKAYDDASAFVASDILEQFYEVPQAKPTFADKAKKKLDASKAKIKELKTEVSDIKSREYKMMMRMQSFISNMSRRNTKAMEKLEKATEKRVMRETEAEIKSEYKSAYYRKGIKKASKKMMSWLLHPSKNNYIPDSFVKSLQDVFEASHFAPSQKSMLPFYSAVKRLSDSYRKIGQDLPDIGFSADPDMESMLDELADTESGKSFDEFSTEELKNFYDVVRSMYGFITSANKAFTDGKKRSITDIANAASKDLTGMKQKSQKRAGTWARNADAVLNYSMLEPRTFFKRLGPTMYERYLALEKGLDSYISTSKETIRAAKKAIGNNKTSEWDGKKAKMIEIKELGVTVSPAVLMKLYVLGKRAQAQGHIFGEKGGVAFKNFGDSKANSPITLTEKQYDAAVSYLTPEMKATADALQKYLSENMSAKGNEVTREVYNYSKFTEPDYWPIHVYGGVIPSVRGAELQKNQGEPNIENKGFTKTTVKGAKNPIEVGSIFDDFDQHTVEMAAYNAYLPALLDFKNTLNAKDDSGITVMSRIEDAAGTDAEKYIKNFLRLVNQSRISANLWSTSDVMGKKLLRNVKAAMVSFNASVAAMQPLSYAKANAVISPKYLIEALRLESPKSKKQLESEMLTYSPVANIKDWGYADMGFGKNQRQLYDKSAETLGDKVSELAGKLPSWLDKRTWIRLWSACKLEYMSKHRGEPIDFSAVAERFDSLIYDTQVVNTIFSTSQILNEGTAYSSMLTAFGAESLKSYNMEYNAIKNGNRRSAARTAVSLLFNSILVSAVRTAFSHFRQKDDEDETSPLSLSGEMVMNMIGDASGMILFVRDMQDLARGYESTRMDMEGLSAVADALSSTVTDLGKVFAGEEPKGTVYSHLQDMVKGISYTTGLSVSNIWRDAEGLVRMIAQDFNHPGMEYALLQTLYNPEYAGNKGHYYDLLYDNQEDRDVYDALYKDLTERYGYDEDAIKTAMQNRASKEPDYVKAYESSVEKMESAVSKSDYYNALPASMKEYVTEQMSEYARATSLDKTYEPYKAPDGILRAKEMIEDGLSAGNYLLYKSAMKQADISGDGNGSLNASEKIKAMRDLRFMGDSDRETLFTFMETDASGDTGRSDEMEALTDAGMTFDQFLDVYEKYSELNGDESMEAGDKALTFSKWTDSRFKDYSVDIGAQFDFWSSIPVEAKQYEKLKTAGISEDDAFEISSAINELDPAEEGKSVTVYQKYDAIIGTDIKDSVKMKAIGTIMGETGYVKMTKAVLSGVNINTYIKYVYASSRITSDTKKGKAIADSKKMKLLTYIDSLPITKKQKDILYESSGYAESELHSDAPWYNGSSYNGDIYKKKVDGVAFTIK